MGQQHLRAAHAAFAQLGLIHLDQAHLTNRRGGLQLVDFLGPRAPTQALHAFGHRTAADHDQFTPLLDQRSQLLTPVTDRLLVQSPPLIGDQTGPHLHHNPARSTNHRGQRTGSFGVRHQVINEFAHGHSSRTRGQATCQCPPAKRGSTSTGGCSVRCSRAMCSYTFWTRNSHPSRVNAEISNTGPL